MKFKIKQTNCLFVNFEKRKKKLNEIGNISDFFNNKNKKQIHHIYRQTDIYLGNVKMHRKKDM
jgi:hypothetical protein